MPREKVVACWIGGAVGGERVDGQCCRKEREQCTVKVAYNSSTDVEEDEGWLLYFFHVVSSSSSCVSALFFLRCLQKNISILFHATPSLPLFSPFYRLNVQVARHKSDVQEMVCCNAENGGLQGMVVGMAQAWLPALHQQAFF